jgi:glycine oxidase
MMDQHLGKIGIMGAGIMGLSVAQVLRHNHAVRIVDAEGFPPVHCTPSLMAGGMLAPWSEVEYMPPEFINAAISGIKFWKEQPPEKTCFVSNGTLLLAHREDFYILDRFASKLSKQTAWRFLNAGEIAVLEPALAGRFERGIFMPEEAFVYPPQVLGSFSQDVEHRFKAKITREEGKRDCDWLIDCRGYGAAQDEPELRGVKGEIAVVTNKELALNRPVRLMHPRYPIYVVPRPNHEYTIGATLIESADQMVTIRSALELLSAAYSLHPSFGDAAISFIHAGIRPSYPDNLPRITVKDNVISCNGLFRHGYLLAPVMAQCVADHIAGKENEFLHLFAGGSHDGRDRQRAKENIHRAA